MKTYWSILQIINGISFCIAVIDSNILWVLVSGITLLWCAIKEGNEE